MKRDFVSKVDEHNPRRARTSEQFRCPKRKIIAYWVDQLVKLYHAYREVTRINL